VKPTCFVCGDPVDVDDQIVLARGRRREIHCSEGCLEESLGEQRRARSARRRRLVISASVIVLLLAGAGTLWRHRAPQPRSISYAWSGAGWDPAVPREPVYFGPAWPPTDDDWKFAFDRASWIYPLPGPVRRPATADERILGPEPPRGRPAAVCRTSDACGVTLGGQLWGEHVYAVLDGVVDRAVANASEERGGGYVRIAHFGGMMFTQYFHLAAIPRGVRRGASVTAGDVIGLVGDSGAGGERTGARPHLHFAFSICPSGELPETYWDPTPLMARWPLRTPPHGTVAGLAAAVNDEDLLRRRRGR
jgi:peptidase M23-like protein